MQKIVFLNLAIFLAWLFSYALSLLHFPYLQYIFGLLVFFLPGLNLAFFIEQIAKKTLGFSKIILLGAISSLVLNPAVVYFVSALFSKFADKKITFAIFFGWTILTLILFLLAKFFRKTQVSEIKINFCDHRIFWISLGVFLLLFLVLAITYPFIPEGDPYLWLSILKDLLVFNRFFTDSRPLFISLSWVFLFLTNLSDFWLYKIIFPLISGIGLIFLFYLYSKESLKTNFYRFIGAVSIIFVPVIIQEILISRPQIIFLFCFPGVLYLLQSFLKDRTNLFALWGIFYLFALSFLGFWVHEFFMILILIIFISIIVFLWEYIKKYPFESFVIFLFLAEFFILISINFGLFTFFKVNLLRFVSIFTHPKFSLWFLGDYTNIDGVKMGWSKIGQLCYYGYNLGIFLPIVLVLYILKRKKINIDFRENWLFTFSFLLFFSIAEIFPRLGLFYLPDRAWLFSSLILLFFVPLVLSFVEKDLSTKRWKIFFIAIFIISLFISFLITYLKQGWMTKNEYKAANFIKQNLPEDAVFIIQKGASPLVGYYSQRMFYKPPKDFFYGDLNEKNLDLLKNLPEFLSNKRKAKENIINSKDKIVEKINSIFEEKENFEELKFDEEIKTVLKSKGQLAFSNLKNLDKKRPIYILYSFDKFKGLYGMRQWWKEYNFYGANLSKFDKNKDLFELIYDKNGIKIWKVKL